jgi:hypothetical protein
MWFDAGPGADAFAAVLGARIPLLATRPVVPFASASVGVYRATFDAASSRVPSFYQRRMVGMMSGTGQFPGRAFEPVYGLQLAYHFESHPVTPVSGSTTRARRPR